MAELEKSKSGADRALADRRRADRRATQSVGTLFAPGHERHLLGTPVTMVDLSLHGTGFRSIDALRVGQLYGLQINGDWMNLSSRIRIVSCRKRDDGEYDVGAEFF